MRRLRNLKGLLAMLREAGVTEYEHAGLKLKLGAPGARPAETAKARPAPAETLTPDERAARELVRRVTGLSEEQARDLAASLRMDA